MAKGKHSPALFEVVHGKKHVDKSTRTGALRTPNWWFKGRERITEAGLMAPPAVVEEPSSADDDAPPVSSADDPTANASALTLRGREARPVRDDHEPPGTIQAPVAVEPVQTVPADSGPPEPMSIPEELTAPSPRRHAPVQVVMDRDRHEMYVRVRYTTAIVAGFSLVVLIALSYLSGRHTGRGPSIASASPSAEEIAAGPIEKGVADFSARRAPAVTTTPGAVPAAAGIAPAAAFTSSQRPSTQRPSPAPAMTMTAATPSAPRPPEPSAAAPKNVNRTIKLQYVIVQSYPEKEKRMADEACEYLNRAGIPCTVERGVVGYTTADWYCVVGTTAFEKASGPAYAKYLEDIEKVNKEYAGRSRFKRFAPQAAQWRGSRANG